MSKMTLKSREAIMLNILSGINYKDVFYAFYNQTYTHVNVYAFEKFDFTENSEINFLKEIKRGEKLIVEALEQMGCKIYKKLDASAYITSTLNSEKDIYSTSSIQYKCEIYPSSKFVDLIKDYWKEELEDRKQSLRETIASVQKELDLIS